MRDALSGIFDVDDPTGTVTMDSPVWVSGWNAPLLKLTKAAINANRDDTHDLHRLVDDLFSQLQERLSSGSGGPAAFKTLLMDFADYFDRAPRGAALETLQKFGVRTGTPFSSYLRALRVVVASTVEKGGPLAPSATMAIELVRIRTAQQYPTLMPTLFPGDRATREKPCASLALMWTAFADLKHNSSPAINGDAFASAPQVPSSHAPPPINAPTASVTASQRHSSRPSRPSHTVSNVSPVHSRRDPFRIDYGIWPFDDQDYAIVCNVTNHALHTKLSLWTPLLTEERFDRLRWVEIKHGRIAMLAVVDHMVQQNVRLPGMLSTKDSIAFADVPNGLAAFSKIPPLGMLQIILAIGVHELFVVKRVEGLFPGDCTIGGNIFQSSWDKFSGEIKTSKRAIELNNGRAAQIGILAMMVHEQLSNQPYSINDLVGASYKFN